METECARKEVMLMIEYSQPQRSYSREEKKREVLELTAGEFTLCQYVAIGEPDDPAVNSKWRSPIVYLKDGMEAFWVRDPYPDPDLVRELFKEGHLSLRVRPHRSNRHVKLRLWRSQQPSIAS